MSAILGIDLSVRRAAVVSVPIEPSWGGDFSLVRSAVFGVNLQRGASDAERARRTETIAAGIVAFAKAHNARLAFFESYAFAQRTAAHTLGECGGVSRLALLNNGVEICTANMGSARKLLLGRVPRTDVKVAVFAALRAAGAHFDSLDEADAFVAANLGLSDLGCYCLAQVAK